MTFVLALVMAHTLVVAHTPAPAVTYAMMSGPVRGHATRMSGLTSLLTRHRQVRTAQQRRHRHRSEDPDSPHAA